MNLHAAPTLPRPFSGIPQDSSLELPSAFLGHPSNLRVGVSNARTGARGSLPGIDVNDLLRGSCRARKWRCRVPGRPGHAGKDIPHPVVRSKRTANWDPNWMTGLEDTFLRADSGFEVNDLFDWPWRRKTHFSTTTVPQAQRVFLRFEVNDFTSTARKTKPGLASGVIARVHRSVVVVVVKVDDHCSWSRKLSWSDAPSQWWWAQSSLSTYRCIASSIRYRPRVKRGR